MSLFAFRRIVNRNWLRSVSAASSTLQKRALNIHEYAAHDLLRQYDVPTAPGKAARTPDEALAVAQELGGTDFVVKAQVLAGGRGKGTFKNGFVGGVHPALSYVYSMRAPFINTFWKF